MNKIYSVDFKYRVPSKQQTRTASRAVVSTDPAGAVTKLLGHIRDREGWCSKCNRSSDMGHGTFRNPQGDQFDPVPCDGKFESEAEAELHNNPTVSVICEDHEPRDRVIVKIPGCDTEFGFDQPGNHNNPAVLR